MTVIFFKRLLSILMAIFGVTLTSIPLNFLAPFSTSEVLAQTRNLRKAEADRLLVQGNRHPRRVPPQVVTQIKGVECQFGIGNLHEPESDDWESFEEELF